MTPVDRPRPGLCGVLLIALACAGPARGDGGLVRLSEVAGPLQVTVFSAPTPLRAGPVDISVLLRDRAADRFVIDAAVTVTLRADGNPSLQVRGEASRDQATNKLLYAALLDLPAPGRWRVEVAIDWHGTPAALSFAVDAAPPLPPWRAYWPYFALPAVAIALFTVHQWLVLRRER